MCDVSTEIEVRMDAIIVMIIPLSALVRINEYRFDAECFVVTAFLPERGTPVVCKGTIECLNLKGNEFLDTVAMSSLITLKTVIAWQTEWFIHPLPAKYPKNTARWKGFLPVRQVFQRCQINSDINLKEAVSATIAIIGSIGERFVAIPSGDSDIPYDMIKTLNGEYDAGMSEVSV